MTYQTIRPAGLPYAGDAYLPILSDGSPYPATYGGTGDLADDVDATYVSLYGSQSSTGRLASCVAVDFDPQPDLVIPDLSPLTFGATFRVELLLTQAQIDAYALGLSEWGLFRRGDPSTYMRGGFFKDFVPESAPITTPTTYASGTDTYSLSTTEATFVQTEGFTLAFEMEIDLSSDTPFEGYRVFEAGIMLNLGAITTHAPPLRQYPRSDGLGASSARRVWPPSRSIQASNRRVGGYL